MKYKSVPSYIESEYFSLGTPKYDGDTWSVELTPSELSEHLINNDYTHLFLYNVDDYLIDNYDVLFKDEDSIVKGGLYEISVVGGSVEFDVVED